MSVSQTVSVAVLPGGPISISPQKVDVTLSRVGGGAHFRGSMRPVTIVDPRGSLEGWVVSVGFNGPTGVLHVRPLIVTGTTTGEVRVLPAVLRAGDVAPLAVAAPGGGGGTYVLGAELDLVVPRLREETRRIVLSLGVR